ncbi:MAG TPA: hypothetical protein VKK79_09750 [Candidatus Lokiarchaeia archaeon]|nr:hypothetical protein [Candidatus Lokiarchaeia archaeon]
MLDLILILDAASGIALFEHQGAHVLIDGDHADIFSGFLSAVQSVTVELKIGALTQLSTDTHHCIIHREGPIMALAIVDSQENVAYWQFKTKLIGEQFARRFVTANYSANNLDVFSPFEEQLVKIVKLPIAALSHEIDNCMQ